MSKVEEIAEQIRNLSDAELVEFRRWYTEFDARFRGNVADVDADRGWLDEVQRRSAEFDAGRVKTISAEQVFERVRARLKQSR